MPNKKNKVFLNTFLWGLALWLFGYILGIIFFAFVPENLLGWVISPFGWLATILILFKKVKRDSLRCYLIIGVIWTIMAIVLDYAFIVKLFASTGYYKLDVYFYYLSTLILPVAVGWYKLKKNKDLHK